MTDTPARQPHPQQYIIDREYIEKLDCWLEEHGIDDLQRMQIRARLKLNPIEENHCGKCDHWDMCEGCPYTEDRATHTPAHPTQQRIDAVSTDDILKELKQRYRKEAAILDYVEMIECPWCKGTGKNLYDPGPCPACMGAGSRPARSEQELREAAQDKKNAHQ